MIGVSAQGPVIQLAMVLDGSDSISQGDWITIVNGLADAVANSQCVPHNGSVEVMVVQFGYGRADDPPFAKVELEPVVITAESASTVADQIRSIGQGAGGITPMAHGLQLAVETITGSPNFQTAAEQVINMSTDGTPMCLDGSTCSQEEAIADGRM